MKFLQRMMLCVFVLSCMGCKAQPTDYAVQVQTHYANLSTACYTMFVNVNLGENTYDYLLSYDYQAQGADTQTILEPESVADIALRITGEMGEDITLQYADTVLDYGMVAGNGCSPADGMFYLLHDLTYGTPTEVTADKATGRAVLFLQYEGLDSQQGIDRAVWVDAETYAPIAAEVYQDGERRLTYIFQ